MPLEDAFFGIIGSLTDKFGVKWMLEYDLPKKVDIKGTIKVIGLIPGLGALIAFNLINNLLGGVYMALMDAYGLSLVTVEMWGLLWGVLSTAFIIGGILIAKFGLGKVYKDASIFS